MEAIHEMGRVNGVVAVAVLCALLCAEPAQAQQFMPVWQADGDELAVQAGSFLRTETDALGILVRIGGNGKSVLLGHFMFDGKDCAAGFGRAAFRTFDGTIVKQDWALGAGTGWATLAHMMCELRSQTKLGGSR